VKRVVEDLVRTRLLALRAIEKGYDRDPDIVRRHARQLAQAYVEKQMAAAANDATTPEEDLRVWFDAHRSEFARDELARVALVSLRIGTPNHVSSDNGTYGNIEITDSALRRTTPTSSSRPLTLSGSGRTSRWRWP
jgi:hypothetical protein